MLFVRIKSFVRKPKDLRAISQKTQPLLHWLVLSRVHIYRQTSHHHHTMSSSYMTHTHLCLALHQAATSAAALCCHASLNALCSHFLPNSTCYVVLCHGGGELRTPGQSLRQVQQLAIKADLAIPIVIIVFFIVNKPFNINLLVYACSHCFH